MKIITTPDPRLRAISEKVTDVTDPEVLDAIAEMRRNSIAWEAEHPHELSAAMAAPQLGINKRIIIVREDMDDKSNNNFTALINPEIIRADGKMIKDFEGCLSVPFIYGMVPRHDKVRVKAILEDGTPCKITAHGYLARTLLHEIDHLDGVLFIDHIKDNEKAFYRMTESGDLEPIADYETEIKNNKDLFPDDEE